MGTNGKSEFTVQDAFRGSQSSAARWLISHIWRTKWLFFGALLCSVVDYFAFSQNPVLIGKVAEELLSPTQDGALLHLALLIFAALMVSSVAFWTGGLLIETLAQRLEVSARQELYISLLGKSQTFHDRQRVGDIMARATDDVRQLNAMVSPGLRFIYEMVLGIAVPITLIATINTNLLLVPLLFVAAYIITVRHYTRRLNPVMTRQREQFGQLNAGLEEVLSGIEVVKASVQEAHERGRFRRNARLYRDYFVEQGMIEARYLPLLLFGIALGLTLLHSILLYRAGSVSLAEIIAVMGLMNVLRFPVFSSIFSFSLVQLGLAGAERLLQIITAETELDENVSGYAAPIRGDITFENVSFCYEGDSCEAAVIEDVSFHIQAGQTVAVVGQTGSGKSTLSMLINRTYDVSAGRVLVDGVDVREWNLDVLRSQISKIEQDVFLFTRTVAENIAFGAPGTLQDQIERAAREAQAHDFILTFEDGYQTKVGERGVTLSGGQRQRIALARAFLSDPRILILDDSTSAIDSATEDEIQKAIRRAQQGRTTILITHRLSQIRWADVILVLDQGRLVAAGSHDGLLRTSPHYRRIFARYDLELPPLEVVSNQLSVVGDQ
ncbi:MAG: ABC transporter ATP-binding protein/permease [Anaerolineae bacterium]|nr:ABC transporter ATP-binding protein/permease [Anaerolineae bacterium]